MLLLAKKGLRLALKKSARATLYLFMPTYALRSKCLGRDKMKKLLYFVTEDWYFVSHRLQLALMAQQHGYQILVVTRCKEHVQILTEAGFTVIHFATSRRSLNPIVLMSESIALAKLYRALKPSIVHHVALRPVIVGAIAARLAGISTVISAITGMGFLFVEGKRAPIAQSILFWLFPKLLGKGLIIVQNEDDQQLLLRAKIEASRIRLIPGAGVDAVKYCPQKDIREDDKSMVVMMASRLLWDKGVREFVQAARILRRPNLRFVMVGEPDLANPAAVATKDLAEWVNEGAIEHWGHRDDMHNVLVKAQIVCLPSYREGFPKVLLEAMACGLPCVTTDVPGCRAAVRDGDNGLLVRVRDAASLAIAIEKLVCDANLRVRMGQRGRARVLSEFSQERIIEATLTAYSECLAT